MTPLSAVIITFNESKNIERCILSVKQIADEIVVVDSHSTDNTVQLAKQLGAKVYLHPFEGHIEQKNYAVTQATYPHILSLDADEWLEDALIERIASIKRHWDSDGYLFNRLNNYCGKWIRHGAWYPDKKLRLWDSRKGRWTGTNPHDEFRMEAHCRITYVPLNIRHQSYRTIAEHAAKTEYFSTLASKAYFEKGKKSGWIRIWMSPAFRFFRDYVIKRGFLDGYYGLVIAAYSALEVHKKYRKLNQLVRHSH